MRACVLDSLLGVIPTTCPNNNNTVGTISTVAYSASSTDRSDILEKDGKVWFLCLQNISRRCPQTHDDRLSVLRSLGACFGVQMSLLFLLWSSDWLATTKKRPVLITCYVCCFSVFGLRSSSTSCHFVRKKCHLLGQGDVSCARNHYS